MLRLPFIRGLAVAEFVSAVGSTVAVLAIAFLSYNDSKSVIHTVFASAAYSLPTAVLGMHAGRVAARFSHRRLLLICTTVKPLIFLVMAGLAAAGALGIGRLMFFSALAGCVAAFNTPAWMEFERDLVPGDRLDEVNALFGAASGAASVVGAGLGGVLLGTVGTWSMFLVDALSFVPFLVVLRRARPTELVTDSHERLDLRGVLRYIGRNDRLRIAFGRTALLSLLVAPVTQLLPAIATDVSGDTSRLGLLTAMFSTGAIALAWLIGKLRARYNRVSIINATFVVSGVLLTGFGVFGDSIRGRDLWVVVALALVPLGLLIALAQSVLSAIVAVHVDPEMEAGVFSVYAIVYTVLAPIGGFTLGQVADHRDVWDALTVAGVVVTIASVVALSFGWRHPNGREGPDGGVIVHGARHFRLDALLQGHVLPLHRQRRRAVTRSR